MKLAFPPKKIRIELGLGSLLATVGAYFFYLLLEFGLYYQLDNFSRNLFRVVYSVIFFPTGVLSRFKQAEWAEGLIRVILTVLWIWFLIAVCWVLYHSVKDRIKIKNKIVFPPSEMQILFWSLGVGFGIIIEVISVHFSLGYLFKCGLIAWFFGSAIWMIKSRKKKSQQI